MFELVSRLSFHKGFCIAIIIFGIYISPYFLIYEYSRDVFEKYSIFQSSILVLILSIPILIFNLILELSFFEISYKDLKEETPDKHKIWFAHLALSSFILSIAFYTACIVRHKVPRFVLKEGYEAAALYDFYILAALWGMMTCRKLFQKISDFLNR